MYCIKYLEISFFSKFSSLGKCFLLWINYTIWSEGLFIVSVDWYDILLLVEIPISDMQCATIVPLSSVNIGYVNITRSTGSDPSFLSMYDMKKKISNTCVTVENVPLKSPICKSLLAFRDASSSLLFKAQTVKVNCTYFPA